MSTFAVFLSLYFCVLFLYMFTKTKHLWSFMRKTFLCTSIFLYMTNFFCTRIRTLFFTSHGLYTNPIYIQRFFIFSNTHLWFTQNFLHIHSLLTHTRIPFHASFTHKNPSIHIFLLHTCINKTLFLFFMNTFIHNASFFLLVFLIHFTFRTTFLNEKLYTVPEFQQTLLTTMKQVPT